MSAIEEAPVGDPIGIKGMFRVQIENPETGEIVGDSGYHSNLITNDGFNLFLCALLGKTTGSIQITHMALGTGGAPVATDDVLSGEQSVRQAVTAATSSTSKTIHFTGTFSSSNSFVTATKNLSNIGLFGTSSAGGGTLFAGNTYASSSCATNQNVNCTYDITFS